MNLPESLCNVLAQVSTASPWALLLAKATLLLAVAWLIHFSLARANPRWRTLLWRGAVLGLVLTAVWTFGLPGLEIRVQAPEPVATAPAPSLQPMVAELKPATLALTPIPATEATASVEMTVTAPETVVEVRPAAARSVASFGTLPSWRTVLLGIWGFGVGLLVVRMAIAYVKLRDLLQTSQAASEEILAEVRRIANAVGCHRAVQVRSSRQYAVPFLYGLRRPVLVLPERMCQPAYRAQLPGVIAHELAHVGSCDFGWNAALQTVSILLWFHPLAWRIGSAHRAACDAVCDAISASYLGDVQGYCRTLARVALEGASSFPAAGLAMARSCDVRCRIAVLQQRVFSTSLGRRTVVGAALVGLLSVALLAGVRLALAEPPAQESKGEGVGPPSALSPTATNGKQFALLVVGPDGKPVSHAEVEIRGDTRPTAKQVQRGQFVKNGPYGTFFETDDSGRLVVKLPKTPNRFNVSIKQPGFGPYWATWDSSAHPEAIPSRFTAELEAGWTVGSMIVDANGLPVKDVNIRPSIKYKKRPGDNQELGVGTQLTTDAEGKWRFDSVPVSMSEVFVSIDHPDYKPNRRPLTRSEFGIEAGHEPKARITLKRGLEVTGAVHDESGKPIAGAVLRTKFHNDLRQATTGPDGTYRLVGCEPRMARIVVSATGKARDFQKVLIELDMKPVDFVMKPGGKIRVRVLDDHGHSVAKTRIFFQQWRGHIQYFEFDDVNQYADEKGVWEWNEAPLDEIKADICPPGGMQLLEQPLVAREKEYVFRVPPLLVILGDVTDAATGKPIKRFRVVPGRRWEKANAPFVNRRESFEAVDGHYELRSDRGYQTHLVRIEADGYEVAASRDISSDEGKVRIDFQLKPADDIAATIVMPTGKPAAGAEIALGIAGSQINVKDGDINNVGTYAARREADEAGRFRFPSQGADFQLVITHPSGFAYLKSTGEPIPSTIRLTPWARVEGTFRVGQRTVPSVGITLNTNAIRSYGPDVPNISADYNVTTGADGRFVFERVFPGDGRIGRRILLMGNDGATEVTSSKKVAARFVAGETTKLDLGGTGRPVTGRLAAPAGFQGKVLWNFALVNVRVGLPQPKRLPIPADVQNDPARRKAWWNQWKATDEGKAWQAADRAARKLRKAIPYFTATVDRDGSFRIDDVPAGEYELNVRFSQHSAGYVSNYRFSVPETSNAEPSRPIDLGVLTLAGQASENHAVTASAQKAPGDAPVARRNAAQTEQEPKAGPASESKNPRSDAKVTGKDQPAKPKNMRTVSMSAEDFGRLSAADQRDLLVRVFQRRLEQSKNLYYETEQSCRSYENHNGELGEPLKKYPARRNQYRHWRLGDSFRMDDNWYENRSDAEPSTCCSCGLNAAEGLGRNTMVYPNGKRPPQGQVQYRMALPLVT